jgi:lipoprotein-anchoring transpeptidase ErfK/SrfK
MEQAIARGVSMRSIRLIVLILVAFVTAPAANAEILITVDKSVQRMVVLVDGSVRWVWPVSTGRRGYETPDGSYTVFWLDEDHYSEEWDDAPMPHSIFFTKRGHAIHGSYDTKRLGTPMSHGCVRLHPANAARLFALVERAGVAKATVVITSGND